MFYGNAFQIFIVCSCSFRFLFLRRLCALARPYWAQFTTGFWRLYFCYSIWRLRKFPPMPPDFYFHRFDEEDWLAHLRIFIQVYFLWILSLDVYNAPQWLFYYDQSSCSVCTCLGYLSFFFFLYAMYWEKLDSTFSKRIADDVEGLKNVH